MRITTIIYIILFSSLALTVTAQERVYNTFSQDSIGVGETAQLILTVDQSTEPNISSLSLSDIAKMKFFPPSQGPEPEEKQPDITVINYGKWNDKNSDGILEGDEIGWEKIEENGKTLYRNVLDIAFYDFGIYVFEGFNLVLDGSPITTNRAILNVKFKDYNLTVVDSTGMAPIKNIEREGMNLLDLLPIAYVLLGLLVLGGLIFYFIKKRNNADIVEKEEEVIVIPPDVKALTGLKELRGKQLWQKGEIKQYQSELTHIIREYLEGRYGIHALEQTTSEIVKSIDDKSFDQEDQEKLTRILQMADLVKFAKAKPSEDIHETFMEDAFAFVQKTRSLEINKEEEE